jgi:hypothetical protein
VAKAKNFTKADGAVDKFFMPQASPPETEREQNENGTGTASGLPVANTTEIKTEKNSGRGKRTERLGLVLDERLKDDLKHLSLALGNKSVNDFIITILLEYVGREDNQKKLGQYKKLLEG